MIDGASVVQQAELQAGHKLTCEELYHEETIESYYSVHRERGDVLYFFSFFAFLWIPFLGFMGVMFVRTFWRLRWVAGAATVSLIILILLYLPVVGKISCALE